MPHWCWVCDRNKSNESFSGKGHKHHVCKACMSKPKEERDAVKHQDEIFGFLNQSNISTRNIARLRVLCASTNAQTAKLANLALEVALVKPHKRRRLKFLGQKHPELLMKLKETGLIYAHCLDWDVDFSDPEMPCDLDFAERVDDDDICF